MKRTILLVAAAIAVFALACAPTASVKPQNDEQLRVRHDAAQASYSIGQQYFAQGDFEAALRNFNEALTQDSTFYEAYIAVGAVYRKMRDAGKAEEYYSKALALDPTKPKAYEGLGDLYLSMGNLDRALETYLNGLKKDSTLVDLYNGAAEIYVKKNQMAEADLLYQTAMRRFPDDQNVQRLWADFLYKQERYQDAVNALLPVVARFPKVNTLRQRLADCYIELKKFDAASAQFDTILINDPSDNQTLLRKGAVLMMQDKPKQAAAIFESLTQKDSTKAAYWAYWAEAQIQQGNSGSAEAKLRKALALSPDMAQAYVDLGDIRLKSADAKRGTNLPATSKSDLLAARALYEEAKGLYNKAGSDPAYASYARSRVEYLDKNIGLVDKELFVR